MEKNGQVGRRTRKRQGSEKCQPPKYIGSNRERELQGKFYGDRAEAPLIADILENFVTMESERGKFCAVLGGAQFQMEE
jgi:hypothetical protein